MKCRSCDHVLNPQESTNRSSVTGEFLDLCTSCIRESGIVGYVKSKNIPKTELTAQDVDDELNDSLGG